MVLHLLLINMQNQPLNIQVTLQMGKQQKNRQYMSLNYGQSDGIISDRLLHHMDILLEVKYLNFDFFL
jgi:hypothetical protein